MTTTASHFSKTAGRRSARTGFLIACATVLAAVPGSPWLREVRADPTPAATASPAASPAATASPAASPAAAAPLDALDLAKLRPHVNEKVEVHGTPTGSGHNKPGSIAYLNFGAAHQAMSLVFFLKPGQAGKAGTVDDLKPFVGKAITVTGTLTDYKGDLQIVVETLDQIKAAP